ncbi:integrase arm-type DNA-binding domain-containing protein [Pseudomonas baltica]|uniref:tyrosine-type recombinase/integrase n=1 Tax=Pseudomonas baltica TaxID=2762576 RepID=UPI0028A1A636|nr:integrase arm-type DNA-binding domain-containing protein [Pseudomonas baltica]
MALSDLTIRQAKATGSHYTINDIDGLSLAVSGVGGKSWHFRYYWADKQKRMSLGSYPEVSLREARALRDGARVLLSKGVNPRLDRKQKRQAVQLADQNIFKIVYEKWLDHRGLVLKEGRQSTLSQIRRIFTKDVLPMIGRRSIYELQRPDLLDVVAQIERRGALTAAEKVRTWFRQLFRYALVVVPGLQQNPAFDLDVVALPQPPVRHNPFLRMEELPSMLQQLRNYPGRLQTQLGLRLLLLTGVRTGELRLATPDQFDLSAALWIIPPEVVKQLQLGMRKAGKRASDIPPYLVPLSEQALEVVRYLLDHLRPAQRYLLAHNSNLTKRISENTLNAALKRIGYADQLTGHGIRGTLSTALNEIGYPKIWVDAQLSHTDPNKVSSAYNHAEYVSQRRRMMQDWADRLDLFEQNRFEVASKHLTVRIEAVPRTAAGEGNLASAAEAGEMLVPANSEAAPVPKLVAGKQRISAITGPMASNLGTISDQREKLEIYNSPHNLPAGVFAKLSGRSRRWISYEIKAKRVLALAFGNLGHRIPDWHLDPTKHKLVQKVLSKFPQADAWELYKALTRSEDALEGQSAVSKVAAATIEEVFAVLSQSLGESPGLH